jgi:predicted ATPase/class 3 adenylate cyclase/predicted Ser/Thr protein kinase
MQLELSIDETLYTSPKSTVYKARYNGNPKPVVLKVAESIPDHAGLQNELKILNWYYPEKEGITFITYNNKPALVRDFIPGQSLLSLLESGIYGLDFFKKIALPIVASLQSLHHKEVIHKDISPGNIIVDAENGTAEIIDFEVGSLTRQVYNNQYINAGIAGNLYYMSPEQTGRMNRVVDYRSDYYSLGMVFYEVLTGQRAFNNTDALELIHCHIAHMPDHISELNPEVPQILSSIVTKLTAKQAEERYQSLAGLTADLERYLSGHLNESQESFIPGNYDLPFRLKVSQKAVGRDKEIQVLYNQLDLAVKGRFSFLEVGGYSGVGKTTLVKESLKKIAEYKGIYISGKFEKVKGSTPYYGWIAAFNELASVLLSESSARQEKLRNSFIQHVGELGGVITSFCPRLELFYGPQAELPNLSAKEMQNRFFIALNRLFKALTAEGIPLVVFIDDWQWADDDSIFLLSNLLSDKTLERLMIITALRDNEVNAVHPYRIAIDALKNQDFSDLAYITLQPLTQVDCAEVIGATLKKTVKPIDKLVEVAFEKTQGNPFFLNSFFENIYAKKLLYIDATQQLWDWQLNEISQLHVSDDLAGMIVDKLKLLDEECYEMLQLAAFFGNRFSLKSLAMLQNKNMSHVHNLLWPAIQNCLVLPTSDNYKFIPEFYENEDIDIEFYFVHDKVQQSCYTAYNSLKKAELHFRIAEILYHQGYTSDFDTAVHYLNGLDLATKETDLKKLSELFLSVGYKAFMQSAMERAYEYHCVANSIIPITSLKHLSTWIESAFLGAGKEPALQVAEKALNIFEGKAEKFLLYETLIRGLESISENKTAVQVSKKALAELGFRLPKKAGKLNIIFKMVQAKMALNDGKIKRLTDFPEITDEKKLALIRILNVSLGPFFLSEEELYPLIIAKMVMIGSKYGNSEEITAGYSSFALTLAGIMGAWESGYMLGVESLKLVEKYGTNKNIAVCGFAFTGFVEHHKEPVRNLPAKFENYYKKGIRYGEIIYGNWNINFATLTRVILGQPLNDLRDTFNDIVIFNRQYKNSFDDRDLTWVEFLKSITLSGENDLDAFEKRVPEWQANNNPPGIFVFRMLIALRQWLYGDFNGAFKHLEACMPLEGKMVGSFLAQYYLPFVAVLSLYQSPAKGKSKGYYHKIWKQSLKKLKKQQKYYDYNVNWMLAWMNAEEKRAQTGQPHPLLFEQAEQAAREAGFIFPAVFIRIHRLHKLSSEDKNFKSLVAGLVNSLRHLEMTPVVDFYETKYKEYKSRSEKLNVGITEVGNKTYGIDSMPDIDLMTLVKATESITGELNLDKLLHNLLTYTMQNTGAQFGCFLLRHNNTFVPRLALRGNVEENLGSVTAEGQVSETVIKQVVHSREALILDNAINELPYSADQAIAKNQVKSLFCLPFLHQGKITGIVYLTNSLIDSVFNDNRIALTKMFAGQIAVSVENALLYENMENLVEKRTEQLEKEKQKSEELLLNILPEEVANELKENGRATARRFEAVSVLFTDFVDFTLHSEMLSPEQLVSEIDKCYRAFDDIISKHNIEKVKTIGDSYMAVSGLPEPDDNHALKIVQAALDIRDYIQDYNQRGGLFKIRLGIHSGSVIAGIVGSKKFAYDIWGDTVNTAARMEQNSEPDKVNISETTYALIKKHFDCKYRGEVEAKNKGLMRMYFAEPLKK